MIVKRPHLPPRRLFLHLSLIFIVWGFYLKGLMLFWLDPAIYLYKVVAIILCAEFLLLFTIIFSWINYHLFLHRSKIRRNHIPDKTWDYHTDWLQYAVTADFKSLSASKTVTVQINQVEKTKAYLSMKDSEHA